MNYTLFTVPARTDRAVFFIKYVKGGYRVRLVNDVDTIESYGSIFTSTRIALNFRLGIWVKLKNYKTTLKELL